MMAARPACACSSRIVPAITDGPTGTAETSPDAPHLGIVVVVALISQVISLDLGPARKR